MREKAKERLKVNREEEHEEKWEREQTCTDHMSEGKRSLDPRPIPGPALSQKPGPIA